MIYRSEIVNKNSQATTIHKYISEGYALFFVHYFKSNPYKDGPFEVNTSLVCFTFVK